VRKQKCDRDPFECSGRQDAKAPRSPAPPVLSRQRHSEELKSSTAALLLFAFPLSGLYDDRLSARYQLQVHLPTTNQALVQRTRRSG